MTAYPKSPSSTHKLLASVNTAIGTSAEDLATYVDCTPFEYLLITLVSAKLAAETGTDVTLTVKQDTASNGATATAVNDNAGAALSAALGSSAAAGQGLTMQVRCRGLKQYVSPVLTATGAAVTCAMTIHGVGPRDTAEISAHWTDEAGASIAASSFA